VRFFQIENSKKTFFTISYLKFENSTTKSIGAEDSSANSIYEECKDIFNELDKTYKGSILVNHSSIELKDNRCEKS